MDSEVLRQKLEQLTGKRTGIKQLGRQHSASLFGIGAEEQDQPVVHEGHLWVPLYENDGRITAIWLELDGLTPMEVKLVNYAARNFAVALKATGLKEEGEIEARQLSGWLNAQLEQEKNEAEIPDEMTLKGRLVGEMIPFLLVSENVHNPQVTYRSLMKLLRSYFENEILLIPLQEKEWLILARKELLTGGDDKEDEEESADDLLAQTCMGLHELIASEWVGVFHLAVAPAIIPVKGLTGSVALLRETIILGRIFQVGDYIHLPWELHMERLVNSIPDDRRRQLLGQIGDYTSVLADKEMLLTLETFFEMDCNVSETAKKLYIHRNTLLYRLDKIKQETGADVRSFGDAAIVKLAMLLYKVTKRK
ncbi:PucR family transcriptional regulator [Paenibacillus jilunlii]|uniref:Carbohydrate diacid regulator n=1 Tax=Paenibacillus jilunlii TaxID=682956 RepID=A0A1G9JFW6_9BACL|nr:helix-turn-helix domain-containing protein [Paenibacillus jilunlii]KWX74876.1 polyketide synthase regulator [Paenibacillus jilunlii]SDL36192.1 carbohydrate diacid regulator [Paenibacillus jilunlii]